MGTYTVENVMPTGKVDAKYGTEYMVKYKEDDRVVKVSRKVKPEVGATENGEINETKYGAYFKKDAVDFKPQAKGEKREWKDNSDGMRQGMCFNNATAYVNTLEFPQALTDREWADIVFSYAKALYEKGDLTGAPLGSQPENVGELFNEDRTDNRTTE